MADKRFWSGAIIVVTVAVAGAGAVPSLLLRPAAEPIPFEQTFAAAAAVSKPAEPKPAAEPKAAEPKSADEPKAAVAELKQADAKPAAAPPAPPAAAPLPPAVASAPVALQAPRDVAPKVETRVEPKIASAPASAPVTPAAPSAAAASVASAPAPAPAATPVVAAAPAASPPAAEAFPPVQPIGVAMRSETASAADQPRSARTRGAARRWIRIAHGRLARVARRGGGNIRPAAYPIREFLAWRR